MKGLLEEGSSKALSSKWLEKARTCALAEIALFARAVVKHEISKSWAIVGRV